MVFTHFQGGAQQWSSEENKTETTKTRNGFEVSTYRAVFDFEHLVNVWSPAVFHSCAFSLPHLICDSWCTNTSGNSYVSGYIFL